MIGRFYFLVVVCRAVIGGLYFLVAVFIGVQKLSVVPPLRSCLCWVTALVVFLFRELNAAYFYLEVFLRACRKCFPLGLNPTRSRVFLNSYYFLHCRIIGKTSKL